LSESLLLNTQALYSAAGQLADSGALLTLLNLITIACGLILMAFIMVHLKRQQQNKLIPAALFIVGIVGMIVGFRLLGIVGTPIGLQPYAVAADEATQHLLMETKRASGLLAGLSVVGLTSGMTYATAAGVVIWNNWRKRARTRVGMEVAAA
jgi:xanthosine utilization system XapX-like protein